MAGQIRMTPQSMRDRARDADKQAQAVQEVMRSMDQLLNTLKGEWEGEAMQGYEARYNEIKPSFLKAKELIEEIAQNLRSTAQIIEETDRNIGNQYRGGA